MGILVGPWFCAVIVFRLLPDNHPFVAEITPCCSSNLKRQFPLKQVASGSQKVTYTISPVNADIQASDVKS
jgi:hypothetical protein